MISPEDAIELLPINLLKDRRILRMIDRNVEALNISLGWHYRLDVIWIIQKLWQYSILPPAKILDAGAGNGVLQFILAELGYRVVSVDFLQRSVSRSMALTHKIVADNLHRDFDGQYLRYLSRVSVEGKSTLRPIWRKLLLFYHLPWFIYSKYLRAGVIKMVRADISNLTFLDGRSVDAVVSVSVIEHLDSDELEKAIAEMMRVVRIDGGLFITTSAARDKDWLHSPSQGWCFSSSKLKKLFSLSNLKVEWDDYDGILNEIKNNDYLREHLPASYRLSGNNGMPWGIWNPQYVPVGIAKRIRSREDDPEVDLAPEN